jgi:hypothetical protein
MSGLSEEDSVVATALRAVWCSDVGGVTLEWPTGPLLQKKETLC